MDDNRNVDETTQRQFENIFCSVIDLVRSLIGRKVFRPWGTINAAVFDSVMIGLAKRITDGPIINMAAIRDSYQGLFDDDDFMKAIKTATTDEESVRTRLGKATMAFCSVK